METAKKEIIIELDGKKTLILTTLLVFSIVLLYSYVVALVAFVAPSGDLPLDITSLSTLDSSNVSTSMFSTDTVLRVNATIEKATMYFDTPYTNFTSDTSYRLIITILNPNNIPADLISTQKTISPGESQVVLNDYSIPSNAATGTYTIRILLWSDWLPDGKNLAPTIEEVTFDVS